MFVPWCPLFSFSRFDFNIWLLSITTPWSSVCCVLNMKLCMLLRSRVLCFCVYELGSLFVYVVASNCLIIYLFGRLTCNFFIEVLKLILLFVMDSWLLQTAFEVNYLFSILVNSNRWDLDAFVWDFHKIDKVRRREMSTKICVGWSLWSLLWGCVSSGSCVYFCVHLSKK